MQKKGDIIKSKFDQVSNIAKLTFGKLEAKIPWYTDTEEKDD